MRCEESVETTLAPRGRAGGTSGDEDSDATGLSFDEDSELDSGRTWRKDLRLKDSLGSGGRARASGSGFGGFDFLRSRQLNRPPVDLRSLDESGFCRGTA